MNEEEKEGRLVRTKRHLKENKKVYLVGAGCLVGGYILRSTTGDAMQIVKPKQIMSFCWKSQQTMNTIVLPANGDPGDVVQNLRTLETYASKGQLAKSLGISRRLVARYFAGEIPDLLGDQFDVIGKAGHLIPLA